MIGRLRGELIEKRAPDILIDVNGLGYEVQLPMTSFYQLPETGAEAVIYTHLTVREDAHLLFGFSTWDERALFRELIKAQGVGPKLALGILSGMSAGQFVHCVQTEQVMALTKLPGIGKKTAERLVIELRDRLKNFTIGPETPHTDAAPLDSLSGDAPPTLGSAASAADDAVSALVALGYKENQASKAVSKVTQPDMSTEQLIREALRSLS